MARKRKRRWKWLITLLVIAALAGGGYWYWTNRSASAGPDMGDSVRTSPVIRGSISSIVSGSGSVATSREQSLAAPGASTLLQINVEDGDEVSKGDVLFVLDCPEVVSSQQAVSKYEYQLAEYYAARNELQRVADKDYLVTSLSAKVGDKLTKNANLISLLDINSMSLQVPAAEGASWASGQSLQVTLLEYGNTVYGTLSGEPTFSSSNGMDYLTFTLELDKGQRIGNETYGQAFNRTTNNQAAVMLKPNTETILRSPADGYLEVLNAAEGEIIQEGTLMFRISSTNLDSQISDANSEMQVAMANLKQKQTVLTADFDGIYYAAADNSGPKNTFLQIGDSLRSGEGLGKIVDSDRMQIVFNVDELDIAKVEIGQAVNVVADALPNQIYTGRVARIAQEGASSGNVAYYWVLIEVTEWSGLKVGMTSSLEIVVEESFNTLLVPINAVHTTRGIKYVILAEDQTGADSGTAAAAQGTQFFRTPIDGEPAQTGQGSQPQGAPPEGAEGQPMQRMLGAPPEGAEGQPMQRMQGTPPEGEEGQPTQRMQGAPPEGAEGQPTQRMQGTPPEGEEGQPMQRTQGAPPEGTEGQPTQRPQGAPPEGEEGQPTQRTQGAPPEGAEGQPTQIGQPQRYDGSGAGPQTGANPGAGSGTFNVQLPDRAVIVETGIVNDTFVEILSGLEEGQIVEVAGTRANSGMNQGFIMMPGMGGNVVGPGPGATMTYTRID